MSSNERRLLWWFGLRPQLFFVWGGLLGWAIAWIRNSNDPGEMKLLVLCIGGSFGLIGVLANFWGMQKDAGRQWQEEDAEWDRLVNADKQTSDGTSESN